MLSRFAKLTLLLLSKYEKLPPYYYYYIFYLGLAPKCVSFFSR